MADLRMAANLNQRDVAALLGRTQPRIVQIEQDGVNDVYVLDRLAEIYGVSSDTIKAANTRTKSR